MYIRNAQNAKEMKKKDLFILFQEDTFYFQQTGITVWKKVISTQVSLSLVARVARRRIHLRSHLLLLLEIPALDSCSDGFRQVLLFSRSLGQ
mmetsp:Transcript_12131/g.33618  ORF Transcript_12131/g.33618 Transcript_12131/m.33618 type:complete len:92 (+) Transcript_12131:105-380(+)